MFRYQSDIYVYMQFLNIISMNVVSVMLVVVIIAPILKEALALNILVELTLTTH